MVNHDFTRRAWMKTTAAAGGTAMLAGCNGDVGDGDDDEDPAEKYGFSIPEEDVDKTFVTSEFTSIPNINFNPYDPLNHPNQSIYYVFDQYMDEIKVREEGGGLNLKHFPNLAEDWNRDGDVFTLHLDPRYKWHNGDPVTADDVAVMFTLDLLFGTREWDRIYEDVHVEDEHTVVIDLQKNAHDKLTMDFIEGPPSFSTHPDVYEEFIPEDGSRGKGSYDDLASFEKTTLRGKLISMKVNQPVGEGKGRQKQVLGTGPFKLVAIDNRRMLFERHDEGPFADQINYKHVEFVEYTTNQARYQALLGNDFGGLDLTLTQTVWDQLPEHYRKYRYVRKLGHGLAMNYDRFPDHRVRQAIAFAIDKPQVVGNSGLAEPLQREHKTESAVIASRGVQENQFGEGWLDENLTIYDQDTERATELLEAAGYSLDDGKWFTPDDERFAVTIKVPPTWTEFVNMIQTEVQHLKDFGIDADFQTEELVVYYGNTMVQADFDMAHWWTGGARGFPWFGYNTIWNALQTIADDHKHPDTYENVPGPIGEHNGDDTFSINVQDKLDELAKTREDDPKIIDIRRELAWTYNQMMPVYCLNEAQGVASLDVRNWHAPKPMEEVEPHGDIPGNHFFPLHYINNRGLMKATDY